MRIKTNEQLKRTVSALAETKRLIAKEMAYSPHLRKKDYLAELEGHKDKLEKMIRNFDPSFFPLPIVELNEGSKRALERALRGNNDV